MQIIKYSISLRNKSRKSASYYGRIRQDGREKFIPLHTASKNEAERWLTEQRYKYDQYLAGNITEQEIITVDRAPAFAQKGTSRAVTALRDVVDSWERKMRLTGARESTIDNYTRAVRDIADMSMPVTELTTVVMKGLLAVKASCKSTTRRFYSNALRTFAAFVEDEYGATGLCRSVPRIKVDPPTKPFWTRGQMQKIIDAVQCRDKVMERQMKLYLSIMAAVGSRQGETAALTWSDFTPPDRLRFRAETTKGRKERSVPLPRVLAGKLTNMKINNDPAPHSLIFSAIPKHQGSRDGILRRAMTRVGISEGSMHCLRRSVSTILYRKTNDIKAVSQLLGHAPATAVRSYQQARGFEELRGLVEEV